MMAQSAEFRSQRRMAATHYWHLASKEDADVERLDYAAILDQAEKIQAEQMRIVHRLTYRYGVTAIYSEGLSKDGKLSLKIRLALLRDAYNLSVLRKLDAGELAQQREFILTVGTPARLLMNGEVEDVLPLEDEAALQDAKPMRNGKLVPDDAKIDARRRATVKNLPKEGLAVVVLGGSHDLGPHLPNGTLYVKVTPRSYPQ